MSTTPATIPAPAAASRTRRILARALVVVGVLLTLVSLLAVFVKREALDPDHFKQTSQELIANPAIQDEVAAQMVEILYTNVDVGGQLKDELPSNLQSLAGPIAGLSHELADRAARELLSRPRVQDLFVTALSLSQQQLIAVLHGDTRVLETSNGNVVLNVRPLVLQLGDRFNFVSNLADKIPQESAQVTILKSDDLNTAQNLTHLLESVANWIWLLAVAAWAAAIWLARGRRREEVRALGVGLILVGLLVLVIRSVAGSYLVDQLVVSDSVRPAASEAWRIITDSLAQEGWVALAVGVLVALGAWLTGPGRYATSARTALAPVLFRTEVAWVSFVLLLLLILWILPIQSFSTTVVLAAAAAAGFVVLRRQVAVEVPEAGFPDVAGAVQSRVSEARESRSRGRSPSTTDELERLAKLKADGHLSDEEYAAAKAKLL